MKKKILFSMLAIAAAAAIVIGGTTAFFSDTEVSTGNTFTAGAIDLTIDSQQHYNNMVCTLGLPDGNGGLKPSTWQPENGQTVLSDYPAVNTPCDGTWAATDLGASHKFFNFSDVKPGDSGEDTVSLHVNNNDAWLRLLIKDVTDNDNTLTEPEASDVNEVDDLVSGELRENLLFTVFTDANCDNILNNTDVELISAGTIDAAGETWQLPSSIPGGQTVCFGITWNLPPTVGNEVQTDSMSATMEFQVEQVRNNPTPFASTPGPIVAASYETGFEPSETFVLGNINSQGGWMKTGSYDAAVVSSPVINDSQSLRISNAVTSGAFGDQTFAPLLSSGAGETITGASNKHFEAQFNIASVLPSLQSGLAISVSPDNGSGARMSYLSFVDEAGGIRVTFYDVTDAGPLPTVASFNPTDLGLISRSSHTIKFVMDFVDGQANDVVKIYIDNVLVKTGTSWEDYYRFDPEQTGGGNVLSPVNTLIFRAGGAAVPANSGNGFLFDKVSLWSGSL
jgi:predicted ribosomally synthesized peptide with SipW-like signal peptide